MKRVPSTLAYRCCVALLLSASCTSVLGNVPRVNQELQHFSAAEFRQLAQGITSGDLHMRHGPQRALLQNTGFDSNFFNILQPLLQGNTGEQRDALGQIRITPQC